MNKMFIKLLGLLNCLPARQAALKTGRAGQSRQRVYGRPGRMAGFPAGRCLLFVLLGVWLSLGAGPVRADVADKAAPTPEESTESALENSPDSLAVTFDDVEKLARKQARKNYKTPDSRLTDTLRAITEDRWNAIKFKDDYRLWKGDGLPFEIGFFHPGFIYDHVVSISEVTGETSAPIAFNPDWFDSGEPSPAWKTAPVTLDFAGFRIYYPINDRDRKNEVAVFLGGTHFRAVARKSDYGLTARGLILNPALAEGEEIPYFRRFWLVRPKTEDTSLTLFALLDSPSLTGAYQFVIKPGPSTVMDIQARLFKRAGARWPRKIGLAPVASMYLFSEKENGSRQDWRPEVHNSDVLLMVSGRDNWLQRPLVNPERLAVSDFNISPPRGFGLMQRDDNFDHYQDFAARFERRSSLWVELLDDGEPGRLELMEIPSSRDYNDNILAFWLPDRLDPGSAGGEAPKLNGAASLKDDLSFSYRLYWMPPGVTPHQLGRVAATRMAVDAQKENVEFIIDFEGDNVNTIPAETGLASQIEVGADYPVLEKSLRKNPVTGGWRLSFKVGLPPEKNMMQSLISASDERVSQRFKARLIKGENLPESLTETWVYDWPQ